MIKSFLQKNWPHFVAVVLFLLIAIIYCKPALDGMVLFNSDNQGWKGMAQQSFEYKEKYGHYPYWTNSMFSGMPAYQIAFETPNKITIGPLHNYLFTLGLPKPANYFFLACLMMYFLLMVCRINPWVGAMGAIAYAYATYDPIIVATGHDTKMICIGYAPAVIAGLLLIYHRKYLWGFACTALFAAMILWQNHLQVTYYTVITAFAISVAFVIDALRKKDIKHAITSAALALVAGGIALGVNTINIWPMNEFTKETMRGGRSELTDTTTAASNKTKGGLNKDYAFLYGSYGISETFTFMVPGMYGGGNVGSELKAGKSTFAEKLTEAGWPEENAIQYANDHAYWGKQPAHGGPVYFGAIICFLFLAGLLYVKGWLKWGLLAATIFAVILSWGKNLEGINYFLFDHLPLYKKFRAPSLALVIPQLSFVLLACLALNEILFGSLNKEEAWKKFKLCGYITLGVFVLVAMIYFSADYKGVNDAALKQSFSNGVLQQLGRGQQPTPEMQQQAEDFSRSLLKGLEEDRRGLFGKDLLRSFLFVLAAAAMIGLYLRNKLNAMMALAVVAILSTIDILSVATRYLNHERFVEPADFESAFTITPAIQKIMSDPDYRRYRVFDQASGDPYQSSVASYYFNSVGGYSPAKLSLYNDIIYHQLVNGNMHVFNMLNTKYFIVGSPGTNQQEVQVNPGALGNAWFVKEIVFAKNADDEMKTLDRLNTKDSVVIDERYKSTAGSRPQYDSTATIVMKENVNDRIVYESKSATPQFAVFSEVYYPYGWDAYIDGKKADYCRVNYVLRGMPVPAGNHTIEFRFEPRSVIMGDKISMWFNILVYLGLIAAIAMEFRKKKAS